MNIWTLAAVLSVSACGFLFGYKYTGTWKKPKHSKVAVVFKFRRTRYHLHHWMHSLSSVGVFLVMGLQGIVSLEIAAVKFGIAFLSGYGIQGLMVKDAFKVRNYDRRKVMLAQKA